MDLNSIEQRLQSVEQTHLLRFWDALSSPRRSELAEQIEKVDFGLIQKLVTGEDESTDWSELAKQAEPPRAIRLESSENEFSVEEATARGKDALKAGKLGVILVAGGQGTRLGFDHPKGMFELGPLSNRTLFQILIERLRARARRFGVRIPLYLMTSPVTDRETRDFLERHDRFGLNHEDLQVFCQGTMPAVDAMSGRVLLAEQDSLALSPDGHGGSLTAFCDGDCMADAIERGIEHIFYCQIDNPLAQVCDPTLIGYHLLARSEMTTQVVQKRQALEKVGNVVSLDGRTQIIEYSDLPDEYAQRTNADGSLVLWAGNLAIHIFDRSFLERAAGQADALPFHRALKKVPFLDGDGQQIVPASENAIKFERFIFDLLPVAQNAIVVESRAEEGFAPVKNNDGAAADTPEHAKRAMIDYDRDLLEGGGATVLGEVDVEVSPLFALDSREVSRRLLPGTKIGEPQYFAAEAKAALTE